MLLKRARLNVAPKFERYRGSHFNWCYVLQWSSSGRWRYTKVATMEFGEKFPEWKDKQIKAKMWQVMQQDRKKIRRENYLAR